jgi:methanogen homoaconitase small subunit
MIIRGPAVCLGADIDTDLIIAGRYLRTKDRSSWARHVFEDLDPGLATRISGAVIVAGKNFGCGSSREQAAVALRDAGVRAVVAPTVARIFFRNAINLGLPVIECGLPCFPGSEVVIDMVNGVISLEGNSYPFRPLSGKMQQILASGGMVPYMKERR